MKKRIISLLLAVCLLFGAMLTLASCTIDSNVTKMANAMGATFCEGHGYDFSVTLTGTIKNGDTESTVNVKYDVIIDKDDIKKSKNSLAIADNPLANVTYYTDGEYVYAEYLGFKYKTSEITFQKTTPFIQEKIRSGLFNVWSEGNLKAGTFTESDGALTFSTSWSDTSADENHVLSAQPREILESAFYLYTKSYNESSNPKCTDSTLTVTAKDGYVTELTASASLEKGDVSGDVEMVVIVNNPGQDATVTLPAGCESWNSLDGLSSLLGGLFK